MVAMPGTLSVQIGGAHREHHVVRGAARCLHRVLVHPPYIAEELNLYAHGLARLEDRDVRAGSVPEVGVVGAGLLERQALRREISGSEGVLDRR